MRLPHRLHNEQRTIGRRIDPRQPAQQGKELHHCAGQVVAPRRGGRIQRQHDRLRQQDHAAHDPGGRDRPEQPRRVRHAFQYEPRNDRQRRQAIGPGSPPSDREQQEEDGHGQFGIGFPRGEEGVGPLAGGEHPGAEDQDHYLGMGTGRLIVVEAQQPGDSQQGDSDPRSCGQHDQSFLIGVLFSSFGFQPGLAGRRSPTRDAQADPLREYPAPVPRILSTIPAANLASRRRRTRSPGAAPGS